VRIAQDATGDPSGSAAEVGRDMEPMLRRTIGEDIDLRCWMASELPPTVIDPGQVTQLVMNLTVNARDAMPDGGTLTITTATAASPMAGHSHGRRFVIPPTCSAARGRDWSAI